MRFITASYSGALSLESAEYSRDLVKSEKFRSYFPYLSIKQDKDTKSNFRVQKLLQDGTIQLGGNRYSTSVGGTLTGFHGHILLVDDPLDPNRAISEVELNNSNRWMEQTLSTRKVDKAISPTVLIMQRLHQNDPSGHMLAKKKANVKHISLPGEIRNYKKEVKPKELIKKYKNDLLDPKRMNWEVMKDMEADLGQYGYAGQVGQRPTPPGGGMFKVDHFQVIDKLPSEVNWMNTVRYWDKAGTQDGGAYTVGCKMLRLKNDKYIIMDVKRGQWATEQREDIIRQTAQADGNSVAIYMEQEPGSGGKDSIDSSIRNLAGYSVYADRPTGDKVFRADPYSVQVNNGNVMLLRADWNHEFIEEHRNFPFSTYKDQVDASSGAFNKLARKRIAGPILR
jgi:predicted phage terminase large subunit-like protein